MDRKQTPVFSLLPMIYSRAFNVTFKYLSKVLPTHTPIVSFSREVRYLKNLNNLLVTFEVEILAIVLRREDILLASVFHSSFFIF